MSGAGRTYRSTVGTHPDSSFCSLAKGLAFVPAKGGLALAMAALAAAAEPPPPRRGFAMRPKLSVDEVAAFWAK